MRAPDLAEYQAEWVTPIATTYHGWTVYELPPNGQGIAALEMLNIMEQFPLGQWGQNSVRALHTMVEAKKLAYADMIRYDADPRFAKIPVEGLRSKEFGAARAKLIDPAKANCSVEAGVPPGVDNGTTYLSVVDRDGNMVSSTPSGGWLHSSPVIPELGFCLGTRAQMFWLEEGHPASLAPGKRPRSTLTPTLALRDGEPYLAWGSPGGDQQDQWIAQFFLRHVHANMNLQEAIDAPAWHSEHFPASFWPRQARPGVMVVEQRVPEATVTDLRARGHEVEVGPAWSEGRLTAASRLGKRRRAAANPRGMQGYAAGR